MKILQDFSHERNTMEAVHTRYNVTRQFQFSNLGH